MDQPITDEIILQALRKRLLDEVSKRERQEASIVNNVYSQPFRDENTPKGVLEQMMGGEGGEDPFDYFVDIERRDVLDGEDKIGWDKKVHRYRKKKVTEPHPR